MTTRSRAAGNVDRDWLMAAWEWAGELAAMDVGTIRVSMWPTTRRGVWKVTAAVVNVVDGRAAGVVAKVDGEWPNSQHSSFCAYVSSLCMTLDALVGQDMLRQSVPADLPD